MNKTLILAFLATAGLGGSAYLANPPVELQPGTPGTMQTGNVNISGTLRSGQIVSENSSVTGRAIQGNITATTGTNYGGYFQNDSTGGKGIFGWATAASGSVYGGAFRVDSPNGIGVSGTATSTSGGPFGVYGTSAGSAGRGVFGFASSGSGANSGVYGKSSSSTGFGVYSEGNLGVTGDAGIGAAPIAGERLHLVDAQSNTMGVLTIENGLPVNAIPNEAHRSVMVRSHGAGNNIGIVSMTESNDGSPSIGVQGYSTGNGLNYGLYAVAFAGTSNYGLYSSVGAGANDYAGYFDGKIYASSANSGVKSFLIDHPLDPAHKFLEHSSIESDERMNIYRGVARTDARGYASVSVPAWFSALNEEIEYQLTVVDTSDTSDFILAKVVQKLSAGKFRIRSSKPGVEIDWMVSGRRHDPMAVAHPMEVERVKNRQEWGKYLEPEVYGKNKSFAIAPPVDLGQPSSEPAPRH